MVGHAVSGLGQAATGAVDARDKINEIYDEAGGKQLDNQWVKSTTDTLYGQNGFFNQHGSNALTARDPTMKALNDTRDSLLAQASTPRMRAMVSNVLDQRMSAIQQDMGRHAATEGIQWANQQSSARQQNFANDAVTHADDPDRFGLNVQSGLNELDAQGKLNGSPPELLVAQKAKYLSGIHVSVADAKARADPVGASAWVDAHANEMLPEDVTKIRDGLYHPLLERGAVAYVDHLLGTNSGNPLGGPGGGTPAPMGNAPATGPDSWAAVKGTIAHHESGGSNTASPTGAGSQSEGAYGKYQFVGDTWVNLWKQSHGNDGLSRADILAKRADPVAQEQIMNAAGNAYHRDLASIGAPATPGNLYLEHFIGPTAKAVIQADPNAPVSAVLTQAVGAKRANSWIASNPRYLAGKTAGQVVADMDSRMGGAGAGSSAATIAPRRDNTQALYAQIDADQSLTFDQKQTVRQQLATRISQDQAMVEHQQKDALDAAYQVLTPLQGNFTSTSQIPRDVWRNLSPEHQDALTRQAAANAAPKAVEANGDTAIGLNRMAVLAPDQFAKADLRTYRDKMTPGEYGELVKLQTKQVADPGSPEPVSHAKIWGMIHRYEPDLGLNLGAKPDGTAKDPQSRKDAGNIFESMRSDLAATTQGKRAPTDDEVKQSFDRATMAVKVTQHGWFTDSQVEMPRYKVGAGQPFSIAVPNAARDRIVKSMGGRGLAPSEGQIARIYMANKGKPGFW